MIELKVFPNLINDIEGKIPRRQSLGRGIFMIL